MRKEALVVYSQHLAVGIDPQLLQECESDDRHREVLKTSVISNQLKWLLVRENLIHLLLQRQLQISHDHRLVNYFVAELTAQPG
jgi:hypothetical protein